MYTKPWEIETLKSLFPQSFDDKLSYSIVDFNDLIGIHSIDLQALFADSFCNDLDFDTFSILVKEILQAVDNDLKFRSSQQVILFLSAFLPDLFFNVHDLEHKNEKLRSEIRLYNRRSLKIGEVKLSFFPDKAAAVSKIQRIDEKEDNMMVQIILYRGMNGAIKIIKCLPSNTLAIEN